LQEPGRDLRPDTITPAPDITSTGAAAVEYVNEISENGLSLEEIASVEDGETEAAAAETAGSAKTSAPELTEDAASGGGNDEEKQDASPDAAQ
jgi:orotate phosphoribosyltransferase